MRYQTARIVRPLLAAGAVVTLPALAAAQTQFVEQQSTRFPQPPPLEYTNQVALADIDGDNDLDIIWANGAGYSSQQAPLPQRVFINNGAAVFTDESAARFGGLVAVARDAQCGDVDGDKDLDVVIVQDFQKPAIIMINNGQGVFTNESAQRLPQKNLGASHVNFADVDNDGDLDLCIATGTASRFTSGPTQLWLNSGDGHFTDATATHLPNDPVNQPMDSLAADVDDDFDLDLAVAGRGNVSKLFIGDGTGHFTSSPPLPAGSSCYSFDLGDINGDGDLDVLGVNNLPGTSKESMWANNGQGAFTDITGTAIPGNNNPSVDDNESKFFDIDNDGDLDFIIGSLGSTERICTNNGGGVFTLVSGKITAVADSTLDVEVGDLDGDGDLDVVTAQGESGNFTNRIYVNVTGPADTRPPTVRRTEQAAKKPADASPTPVRADIRDDMTSDQGFFAKSVELWYSVDGGPTQKIHAAWSGHDLRRAVIPPTPACKEVKYHFVATDWAGNVGTGPERSFTVPAYADCDASGTLDIDDFICYQTAYGLNDPYADCDGSGGLDIDDFICYQTFYGIGCP